MGKFSTYRYLEVGIFLAFVLKGMFIFLFAESTQALIIIQTKTKLLKTIFVPTVLLFHIYANLRLDYKNNLIRCIS